MDVRRCIVLEYLSAADAFTRVSLDVESQNSWFSMSLSHYWSVYHRVSMIERNSTISLCSINVRCKNDLLFLNLGGSSGESTLGLSLGLGLGIPFLVILMIFIAAGCCCSANRMRALCRVGRPWMSSSRYIEAVLTIDLGIHDAFFQSGGFLSYYQQYNTFHGPFEMKLAFYPLAGYIVHGGGTDDVGTYVIKGVYSPRTLRMGLEKYYQEGTGNPMENLGHTVTIQVEWNPTQEQFHGKYYVVTPRHRDENVFVIQFQNARYRRAMQKFWSIEIKAKTLEKTSDTQYLQRNSSMIDVIS